MDEDREVGMLSLFYKMPKYTGKYANMFTRHRVEQLMSYGWSVRDAVAKADAELDKKYEKERLEREAADALRREAQRIARDREEMAAEDVLQQSLAIADLLSYHSNEVDAFLDPSNMPFEDSITMERFIPLAYMAMAEKKQLERYRPVVRLSCGHFYYKDGGIKKWVDETRQCPLCRADVNDMRLLNMEVFRQKKAEFSTINRLTGERINRLTGERVTL